MKSSLITWNKKSDLKVLDNMIREFDKERKAIISGQLSKDEILEYVEDLAQKGVRLNNKTEMLFWGLEDPEKMPTGAFFEYFDVPTFMATSLLAFGYLNYQEIRKAPDIEKKLAKAFNACKWNGFSCKGYGSDRAFIYIMSIFGEMRMDKFLEKY